MRKKLKYSIITIGLLITTTSLSASDPIRDSATETVYFPFQDITVTDKATDATTTATHADATTACDNLTLGGYSDWRIPTAIELGQVAIQKSFLQNYHATGYYWTYLTWPDINKAEVRDFSGSQGSDTDTNLNYYKCVRDGKLNNNPTIESVTNIQTLQDNSTITPFSDVNVSDSDGDDINMTITLDSASKGSLSGTGLNDNSDGNYTISAGSPIDVNSTLHSIVFTPTANRIVYEKIEYTKIKLTLTDTNDASVTDYNTTIATTGTNNSIQSNTTPNDFSFSAKTEQNISTEVNSSAVTISGINVDTAISITNGYYRIDGGSWTNSSAILAENNTTSTISYTLEVNNTTSANWYETNTTTITIGGVSREFNTTTAKANLSGLTANKWQLKSIGNGKLADLSTSSVDSSEISSSIWVYRDGSWVQNPTNVTPKEGLWVNPTGTTINFKAIVDTSNNLTDANAQYAYYKDLNKSQWHLIGVPNQLEWSNVIRNSNITPDTCPMYSGFYFYDTANSTWNTTTNIPANSGAFIKHICP